MIARWALCIVVVGLILNPFPQTACAQSRRSASGDGGCDGISIQAVSTIPENRNRTTVGVGEKINLSAINPRTSVSWTLQGNGELSSLNTQGTTFTAPERAVSTKISATYNGTTCSVTFNTIEPSGMTFLLIESTPNLPIGFMEMYFKVIILPTSVSFYNIEVMEEQGPASSIVGYFQRYDPEELRHTTAGYWIPVWNDNTWPDTCHWSKGIPKPWQDGSFSWNIPTFFRVKGGRMGEKKFTTVVQSFSISSDGRLTLTKGGVSASNPP